MNGKEQHRERQRLDSKFGIVLQEFRVAQTGCQILFAFLLTLPFQARFDIVNDYQQWLYAVALLLALLATLFFIAPVSQHQILAGHGMKQTIIDSARHIGQAALLSMLASIIASIYLVTDVVFDYRMAISFSIIAIVISGIYWYLRPMRWKKLKDDDE